MQMRVRTSLPKAMVAVGENGSAFIVTDSKATARVDVAWLSRIGFLLVAAFAVPKPQESNKTHGRIRPFAAQQGKLVFIQDGLRRDFRITLQSGEVQRSICGATLQAINQGVRQYTIFDQCRINLLDEWQREKAQKFP